MLKVTTHGSSPREKTSRRREPQIVHKEAPPLPGDSVTESPEIA